MKTRGFWVGCCLGLMGCGGAHRSTEAPEGRTAAEAPSGANAGPSGSQPDFDALLAREATALKELKISGPGGKWTAKVPASAAPTVGASDGIGIVEIPIGSDITVHCEVFSDDIDPAGSIAGLLAKVGAKVTLKQVSPWHVRVAKEDPALYVRALYLTDTPKGRALGELKVGLHSAIGHPVLCLHDELGYEKTFLDLTASFFASLEHRGEAAQPSALLEVQSAKIGETFVGFAKTRVVKDGENRQLLESSSLMMPASPTDLRLVDHFSSQVVDKNGRLVKGVWVEAQSGKIELNVHLERDKGGAYRYAGEVQGKPVQGTFKAKTPAGLASGISIAHLLAAEMKKPKGFSLEEAGYYPDLDPTQAFTVRYYRKEGEPLDTAHLEAGTVKLSGHLDDQGLFQNMQMPMGAITVNFQRELFRGKM